MSRGRPGPNETLAPVLEGAVRDPGGGRPAVKGERPTWQVALIGMLVGLAIAVELANRWITVALCIAVGGVIGAVIGSIRSRRR